MVTELLTAPTRLLHPWRRRAARRALSARAPRSILVVCHGNICRSPFAAVLLQRALGPAGIRVHSAGFIGPNRPSPPEAVTAAARYGVNLSDHRSRVRSEEHTSELQSRLHLVCRLLLEKKKESPDVASSDALI